MRDCEVSVAWAGDQVYSQILVCRLREFSPRGQLYGDFSVF